MLNLKPQFMGLLGGSVKCPILDFGCVMISQFVVSNRTLGSTLKILSLPLSAPPLLMHEHTLSLSNKLKKIN